MHYIHHYLQLPTLDLSNDYPGHHKFEVILFKSHRPAMASLSNSLKQYQALSDMPTSLLLASTKHVQNIIIQIIIHHLFETYCKRQAETIYLKIWAVASFIS